MKSCSETKMKGTAGGNDMRSQVASPVKAIILPPRAARASGSIHHGVSDSGRPNLQTSASGVTKAPGSLGVLAESLNASDSPVRRPRHHHHVTPVVTVSSIRVTSVRLCQLECDSWPGPA